MSALYCHKQAKSIAKTIAKTQGKIYEGINKCLQCNGTGETSISMVTIGEQNKKSIFVMPCINCNGNGTMTDKEQYKYNYMKSVGCKCENDMGSYEAEDGYEIFGNQTYLCNNCDMVTQFG